MAEENVTVAVAESLTGGLVMARIVAIDGAGDWFLGGVVAYDSEVKYELLGVDRGPVITEKAAIQMAAGVRRLLGADLGLSTTGVAGPDPEEGSAAGTVYVGVDRDGDNPLALALHLDGSPDDVQESVVTQVISILGEQIGMNLSDSA